MSEEVKTEEVEYKAGPDAIDLSEEKNGGLLKEIKKAGEGDASPLPGDEVTVHYVGTLLNGDKFDSSRDRKEHFKFTLGRGKVIRGWDVGVASMKKGEISVLVCSPAYGYGEQSPGPTIPSNSTLVFVVELFSWKGEDISEEKDASILKSTVKEAEEMFTTPNEGAQCNIHMTGSFEGRVFEDRDVEFCLGEGSVQGIVPGLEETLKKMNGGEVARVVLKSSKAFGVSGNEMFSVPPGATVQYELALNTFEKAKEVWEMTPEEKLEHAEMNKNKGTAYFKEDNMLLAKKFYVCAIDLIKDSVGEEEVVVSPTPTQNMLLLCYLNAAQTCLKLKENLSAMDYCTKALQIDSNNEKAIFRRGNAYVKMADYDLAIKDFNAVLAINPSNKAAKNQVIIANQKKAEAAVKDKKIFAGMFEKFAALDAKREKREKEMGDAFTKIDDWENKMADDYMTLEQEVEAFGEQMPEAQYKKQAQDGGCGGGTSTEQGGGEGEGEEVYSDCEEGE